jgi:hypothetical protein
MPVFAPMANGESGDSKTAALSKLYDQSFWLYTVIIALAIQQVLIEIIPRFLNYFFETELSLPTPEKLNPSSIYIELVRSLVFLIVITRFYLGGVLVFAKLTQNPDGPPKGSWVHVLTGFIHFLLFFGWAYTPFLTAAIWRVSLFICALILILLWDVAWFWLSPKHQRPGIKPWLYRNLRTVVYMVIAFVSTLWLLSAQTQEVVMLLLVLVISIQDFREMFTKREPPQKFFAPF